MSPDIDECESGPCMNGECHDKVNGYDCVCDAGWTGSHCDIGRDSASRVTSYYHTLAVVSGFNSVQYRTISLKVFAFRHDSSG